MRMVCEGFGKGGLAYACFAADEDHLARSAQRAIEALMEKLQLVATLDKSDGRFGRVNAGLMPRPGFQPLDLAHLGDKPVSTARHSFDVFLPRGRFAEGLAQSRDVVGKVSLFHYSVGPNAMDQLIFVDEMAMRFD
jgi:hypothetical protein